MFRWKRSWGELSERMPLDPFPVSNGEHIPDPPNEMHAMIARIQNEKAEEVRARWGMSRRDFVRTSAAISIGLWAVQEAARRRSASAGAPLGSIPACQLDNPNAQLANFPGEFIFDVQTHHVDEDGLWRVTNPGFHAFFIGVWGQSNCGELDRGECLGRFHYIKEVYLDSSTTAGVLSAVPSSPDRNPLPTLEAAETVALIDSMSNNSGRAVMHQFVMPNRGSYGENVRPGLYLQDELQTMTDNLARYPSIRGWKCYTPWGDIPNASGWWHDGPSGRALAEHAIGIGLPVLATHKGFALPSFDSKTAACRDIGITARDYFDASSFERSLKFVVYHSGFNSEAQVAYPGDATADSGVPGVNGFIKSLRENGWSARQDPSIGGSRGVRAGAAGWEAPPVDGDPGRHANSPTVWAEIGSTWRDVMNRATNVPGVGTQTGVQAAHLLGKLIYFVGPRRVVWGTDSLWYGSPQVEIARFREFPRPTETEAWRILREVYHLPHGLDGDVDDPSINVADPALPTYRPERSIRNGIFGRNAAEVYKLDPDTLRSKIECSDLDEWRKSDELNPHQGTAFERRGMATNVVHGPRTRRELFASVWPNKPWAP